MKKLLRSVVVAATFLLLVSPQPQAAEEGAKKKKPQGWSFRFVQKSETATVKGGRSHEMRGRVELSPGGMFRIDFEKGMGLLQDGCWLVSTDGGRNLALVFPPDEARKRPKGTVARVDVEGTLEAVGAAMKEMKGVASFHASEPRVRVTSEPGKVRILGQVTRKTHVEVSWSLETTIQGVTRKTKTSSATDYWVADSLGDWKLPLLDGRLSLRTGFPEVDRVLEAEASALRGLPLKMKGTTETTDADGRSTSTETSLMILDLAPAEIDEERFRVPEEYRSTDPLSLIQLGR